LGDALEGFSFFGKKWRAMTHKALRKAFAHLNFWQAALFFAILAAGVLGIWWAVQRADLEMREELLTQTRLVAQAVNLDQVKALTGTEHDLALPVYREIKAQLVRVKQANSKCRFVYLLGRKPDGKLFFQVDSEPVGSEDYSPPGQIYHEATAELRRVFADRLEFVEGPSPDRWGLWVSGLVPLTDPHTGEVAAVLGMDINAHAWNWEVAARAALPLGLILALLIIMAAILAAGRRADSSPKLVLRRLLPPLALLLILLMVVSGSLLWQQQKQRLAEIIHREISEVSVDLRLTLEQQASGLAAVLRLIAADPGVQQALSQGDANSLAARWRPVFDLLQRENHVTHFAFFNARRSCLASLSQPDKPAGVRITRFTTAKAEEPSQTVSGLKLDSEGALTLWVLQPVFDRGVLVGYVELGKEIEDVLSALHTRSGLQLAATIRKKHLNRQDWEDGRRRRGREPDWDRLSQRVVSYASQGRLPEVLAQPRDPDGTGEQDFGKMDKEITFEGKTWRVAASPLQDASGQEVGDLLVMFDITAQTEAYARFLGLIGASGGVILVFLLSFVFVLLRHTDQGIRAQTAELRRSEEKYRLLFENAPLGIMHYDQDGFITDLNEAFAAIIGAPKERIIGFNMPQQLRDDQMRQALEASLSGRPGYYEGEYLSVTGGRATRVRAFFRSVYSETGSFQGGVSIFEDYTERFQAEQNRQEYLNFLQILLNAIPNPVFYKDTHGIFLGCNKACEEAWGRSKADLVGKSVFEVHSRELAELHEAKDQELFKHPGMLVYEITKEAADGSRKNFIIHKATFFKGDGTLGGLIGVEVDITERQRAEEALRLNEQRLGALLKLNQMTEATLHDITHFAMEEAVRLTGSKIGYIAFVNDDETVLTMHAWSKNAMAECHMEDKPLIYPGGGRRGSGGRRCANANP
jgi:PAS domain S-box-containing protein